VILLEYSEVCHSIVHILANRNKEYFLGVGSGHVHKCDYATTSRQRIHYYDMTY
jgi:hypothetical protein